MCMTISKWTPMVYLHETALIWKCVLFYKGHFYSGLASKFHASNAAVSRMLVLFTYHDSCAVGAHL